MKTPGSGLRLDSPSWPLLQASLSYWGITTVAGDVLGTTLVDALCSAAGLQPSYAGQVVKILDGGAAGQVGQIAIHDIATGTITVAAPWTNPAGAVQQIAAGTRFVILSAAGGGGAPPPPPPAPGVGLWMFGVCAPGMVASPNTLILTNLAGFNNDLFNNEFWIQVIHNADVPGTAPEREIRRVLDYVGATGTFITDPFTVNVEANDLVCVFHESIMAVEILGYGTLTLSSQTVPEANTRPEANDYFNGCLLMPTEGACRFQPRRIVDWTVGTGVPGTGVFTIDPNNPFTAATGLVDYVIIGDQTEFAPAADSVNNITPSDVIGSKADTALYAAAANASLMRYIKALLNAKIEATGEADAGSDVDTLVDAARAEANDYWNGMTLLMITGNNAGLARRIYDYAVGSIEVRDAFPNAIVATDVYVILSNYEALLAVADSAENLLVRDVIGSKASTAIYAKDATSDIIRYLKGLLDANVTAWGVADAGSGVGLVRDAARAEADDWWNGQTILMLTGAAAFQKRPITDFIALTDDIVVSPNFDAAVGAGDIYVILAHYNMIVPRTADDIANALTSQVVGRKDDTAILVSDDVSSAVRYLKGILNTVVAINSGFQEQPDTAVNILATAAGETDVLNLAVAATRYLVRSLRLKLANPGAETCTVRLKELVNDVLSDVDSFDIDAANFATSHSLMDMFGLPHLAGDRLQVTVRMSGGADVAVTGQYSHSTAT